MNKPVLECRDLHKSFSEGPLQTDVLIGVNFTAEKGETIAIIGQSGSGKSSLLHLLGGLDTPTSGEIEVLGQSMHKLSEKQRGKLRNDALGFVYQFHHLLPEFTALENVAMPLLIRGESINSAHQQAEELLARTGLADRTHHRPGELSGGERQRAAIARALISKPACVLADEPTGNLDQETADKVFELMLELNSEYQTTLIVVTHDTQLAHRMGRVTRLVSGALTEEV